MLFTTFQFAIFLLLVLVGMRLLARRAPSGNTLLLGASLIFYTLWIPAYLPLLLVDIGVNYVLLRGIETSGPRTPRGRAFLAGSIVFTVGLLLFFKYAAFLVESVVPASASIEIPDILLPLGISFYSFQIISLAVDRYRDDAPVVEGLSQYALYVAFFPQLIAGPILRGRELLPQLSAGAKPSAERFRRGAWLIASGVGKKVILADFLLAPFVDAVFDAPGVGNARFHWIALYAFAFQIYFDFSGYTDMARGIALWIGFELPENFHEPYLSRGPTEFWQRWHITLSRWLQLYLFVPMGRAWMRRVPGRERGLLAVAQLVTMAICGLWHGAGWHFVLWGVLQGVLLVTWPRRRRRNPNPDVVRWNDLPHVFAFFNIFCLTLVFFRAADFADATHYLQALFVPGDLPGWPRLALLGVLVSVALHFAERALRLRATAIQAWFVDRPARAALEATAFGLLVGAAIMVSGVGGEFIYFQF